MPVRGLTAVGAGLFSLMTCVICAGTDSVGVVSALVDAGATAEELMLYQYVWCKYVKQVYCLPGRSRRARLRRSSRLLRRGKGRGIGYGLPLRLGSQYKTGPPYELLEALGLVLHLARSTLT